MKAPYTRGNALDPPVVSMAVFDESSKRVQEWPSTVSGERERTFHIGYELKTGRPGDGIGSDKRPIDAAVDQVMRSRGGLLEATSGAPEWLLEAHTPMAFLPVIFTTAKLFVTDANLAAADLATGKLSELAVTPVEWLWYQVNLSRVMRPALQMSMNRPNRSLMGSLIAWHTRAVAIVSVAGIRPFLHHAQEYFAYDRL